MNPFSHWIRWPPQLPNSMRMFCLSRTPWSVHAPLALSRGVDEVMIFLVDPGSWRWQNAVSSWVPGTPEVSLIAVIHNHHSEIGPSGQVLSLVKVSSSIEGQHWPTPIYSEFPLKEGSPWQPWWSMVTKLMAKLWWLPKWLPYSSSYWFHNYSWQTRISMACQSPSTSPTGTSGLQPTGSAHWL